MSKKPPVPVVTDLTLKIVHNLKTVSPPLFSEFAQSLKKYQQAMEELSKQGGILADALYRIGASQTGDLGEGIRKCAEFIKDSEAKREDIATVLAQQFIAPLKANADNEMKEVLGYEKNYKKDRDQARQEIMKMEARTKKAGKKITPEQLKQQISELNAKVKEAETMKANKFREAIILERKKYATLMTLLNSLMSKEIDVNNDFAAKHKANEPTWTALGSSVGHVPKEFEEMIQKQERTYVQIQQNNSDADNYRISYAPNALNTSSSNLTSIVGQCISYAPNARNTSSSNVTPSRYSYEYGNYDSYDSYDGTSYDSSASSPASTSFAYGGDSYAGGGSQARALYDYASDQSSDLSFSAGGILLLFFASSSPPSLPSFSPPYLPSLSPLPSPLPPLFLPPSPYPLSLSPPSFSLPLPPPSPLSFLLFDLSLDTLTIVVDDDGSGWTKGRDASGNEGIFPTTYIEYL